MNGADPLALPPLQLSAALSLRPPAEVLNLARRWEEEAMLHGDDRLAFAAEAARAAAEAQREAARQAGRAAPEAWPPGDGRIDALIDSEPPPRRWFIEHRLPAGRGVLLTGLGGVSKTTLQYQLAIAAVIGRLPWGWLVAETGSAALLLAEDTIEDVHHALASIGRGLELTTGEREALRERLRVFAMAGRDCRLLSMSNGALVANSRAEALIERLRAIPDLRYVGLDPALALTEGKESEQAHQRALGELIDRIGIATGATCVLTSHAAKALQAADEVPSHASRGGGALTDALRAEYVLRGMTAQEAAKAGITDPVERRRYVQLVATKGNHLPPEAFAPLWLLRGPGGVLLPAELDFNGQTDGPRQADMQALELLQRMCETTTPTLSEWRAACVRAGLVSGQTPAAIEKGMQRILQRLLSAELVTKGFKRGTYVPNT